MSFVDSKEAGKFLAFLKDVNNLRDVLMLLAMGFYQCMRFYQY